MTQSTLPDKYHNLLKGKKWQMQTALDTGDGGHIHYTCKALGIEKTVTTPKAKGEDPRAIYGTYGTPIVRFFITGDDREFATLPECLDALIEKQKTGGICT